MNGSTRIDNHKGKCDAGQCSKENLDNPNEEINENVKSNVVVNLIFIGVLQLSHESLNLRWAKTICERRSEFLFADVRL